MFIRFCNFYVLYDVNLNNKFLFSFIKSKFKRQNFTFKNKLYKEKFLQNKNKATDLQSSHNFSNLYKSGKCNI
jgi:uncharacterized protein with von Willebrand factor type A (vWA) domain